MDRLFSFPNVQFIAFVLALYGIDGIALFVLGMDQSLGQGLAVPLVSRQARKVCKWRAQPLPVEVPGRLGAAAGSPTPVLADGSPPGASPTAAPGV